MSLWNQFRGLPIKMSRNYGAEGGSQFVTMCDNGEVIFLRNVKKISLMQRWYAYIVIKHFCNENTKLGMKP